MLCNAHMIQLGQACSLLGVTGGVFHACARLLGGWQVTRFFQIPVMLPRGTPETTL